MSEIVAAPPRQKRNKTQSMIHGHKYTKFIQNYYYYHY